MSHRHRPACTGTIRPLATGLLLALLAGTGPAQAEPDTAPPTTDRLLVANKAANTVTVFDPRTRREVAVLPTGLGPHEVAVAADGRTAVVTDYGAQKPGQTLTVIDVVAAKVLRTLELARDEKGADGTTAKKALLRPHGIQFVGPDRVLVTSESTRRLAVVDVATGAVVRSWTTPQSTMHMVAVTADLKRAVATSIKEGDAALFDLGGDGAPAIVPTGAGAEGLAVNPRTGEAWVANRAANTLVVIGADGKPGEPVDTAAFPFRVAFTPDGATALVACAEGGVVQAFDAATRKLRVDIDVTTDAGEVSPMPMGLCVDPDGTFAYVCCGRGEFVAVLDLAQSRVVARMQAGAGPDGIAYARVRG